MNVSVKKNLNPGISCMNVDQDPLDALTEAFLEAAKPQWKKEEYNRILFCQIGEIQQFKLYSDMFDNNQVFLKTNSITGGSGGYSINIEVPVINVTFCGKILRSKHIGSYHWFDVENCNDIVQCKANSKSLEDFNNVKSIYYKCHQTFRDREKEFEINPILDKKRAVVQSCLLWQLERRSRQIFERLNEIHLNEVEIIGRKVLVMGKLTQKHMKRYVLVNQCTFVEDKEEKCFIELTNLGKNN